MNRLHTKCLSLALALSAGALPAATADENTAARIERKPQTQVANPLLTSSAKRTLPLPLPRIRSGAQDEPRFRGLAPEELLQNRSHDVVLDENRGFVGRLFSVSQDGLVPAAGMNVRISKAGVAVAEAKTDDTGRFAATLPADGVHAVIATSETSMAVYGIRVVAATEQNPASKEIDLESAIVDGSNFNVARELISRSVGLRDLRFSRPIPDPRENEFPVASGAPSTAISYDSVQLAADGKVYGQVNLLDERSGRVREVLSLRVFFLKDGKVISASRVEPNGAFATDGLQPGIHSIVGVGRDGAFAMGIEVLPFKAAGKQEEAVPVALFVSMEIAASPVTAQNLNSGNVGQLLGQASPGSVPGPGVPGAPGAPGGAAPTGGAGGTAGAAGAAGAAGGGAGAAGVGGALAGGAAGALAGAVLSDPGPSTTSTP